MKFKIDENLPLDVAPTLREADYDTETVRDEALCGAPDDLIADRARRESRILITLDMDFANIQAYPPDSQAGIVVLRPTTQDKVTTLAYVRKFLSALQHRSPVRELRIVQKERIRFRQGV